MFWPGGNTCALLGSVMSEHQQNTNQKVRDKVERLAVKVSEAAAIIGVSEATIRRAIKRGLLKPCRAFRHPLIPIEQLRQLVG